MSASAPFGVEDPVTVQRALAERERARSGGCHTRSLGSGASPTWHVATSNSYRSSRRILVTAMKAAGSTNLPEEWWHYTLNHEPFPGTDFDTQLG